METQDQAPQRDSSPAPPEPSSIQPAVNRHVNLYAPARWTGARAAVVTGWESLPDEAGDGYLVNVQVFLDGERDAQAMQRSRPSAGDWSGDILQRVFTRVMLYNALDPAQRPATGVWAEWMPYQVGQAKKKEELQDELRGAIVAMYDVLYSLVEESKATGRDINDSDVNLLHAADLLDRLDPERDPARLDRAVEMTGV